VSKDLEPCHEFIQNLKAILDHDSSNIKYSVKLNLVRHLIDKEMEKMRDE
jgi:hypothetical protein